ncbi:hypothetical protein ANN_04355 [Periplaneta americana]|uniref:Uncharacterized protein n=1 Tax=Periplaneta americana TaxID=6978 RepID=A0ABQ8T929_PERAM|nr:hypothetical protein ANN_04355 [Periplaneta americana]
MSPGSSTESYPAFAPIGLRENPGKNLNQLTCPDRDSNPGHLVSQPDALTVTPQQLVDDDGSVETALINYLFAKQVVNRLRSQMDVSDLQRKRSYWKQCAFNAPVTQWLSRHRYRSQIVGLKYEGFHQIYINRHIPVSEALRNIRHHAVRSMLAEALKEAGFTVHQEVQGLVTQRSIRRIDIIAIKNNSAYILDPTIRFETHADQPHEVDSEKKRIYEPTIPFYKDKYSLYHIDVIGLMVEARVSQKYIALYFRMNPVMKNAACAIQQIIVDYE